MIYLHQTNHSVLDKIKQCWLAKQEVLPTSQDMLKIYTCVFKSQFAVYAIIFSVMLLVNHAFKQHGLVYVVPLVMVKAVQHTSFCILLI